MSGVSTPAFLQATGLSNHKAFNEVFLFSLYCLSPNSLLHSSNPSGEITVDPFLHHIRSPLTWTPHSICPIPFSSSERRIHKQLSINVCVWLINPIQPLAFCSPSVPPFVVPLFMRHRFIPMVLFVFFLPPFVHLLGFSVAPSRSSNGSKSRIRWVSHKHESWQFIFSSYHTQTHAHAVPLRVWLRPKLTWTQRQHKH